MNNHITYKNYESNLLKHYKSAQEKINNGDFGFFLRNKNQQEYHPKNVQSFTDQRFRIAYILQDMAVLCTSEDVSNFIAQIATKVRESSSSISEEEMGYVVKFIRKGKDQYEQCDFVDLLAVEESNE